MTDTFYRSDLWRALCAVVHRRSGGRCEVPGCDRPGKVVDHIKPRRQGGADHPSNLRHLCRLHDNQVKEDRWGKRKRGGVLTVPGCRADGMPLDPNHWWNTEKT